MISEGPERIFGLETTGGDCPEFLPTDYVRADIAERARVEGAEEEREYVVELLKALQDEWCIGHAALGEAIERIQAGLHIP